MIGLILEPAGPRAEESNDGATDEVPNTSADVAKTSVAISHRLSPS